VDHSKGWMQSKETGDIYSTQVLQTGDNIGRSFFWGKLSLIWLRCHPVFKSFSSGPEQRGGVV
jgi:hypothetical protein